MSAVEEVSAMFDDLKRKTDAYWALVDARKAAEDAFADVSPDDCEDCQTTGGCRCNQDNR